jgi:hypothetical protein
MPGFRARSVVEFDLAEVVIPQKEASASRCCHRHNVAFPLM